MVKIKQKISATPENPPKENYPAISVILPLYNVEKYVGACLESILLQTFKNYEVIVVDDCSTDSSAAIVESYIPKFDGRLNLIKRETNSGGANVPRNNGLSAAHGEYVYFVDSDDVLTPRALECFYQAAKAFDADVVYASQRFIASNGKVQIQRSHSFSEKPKLYVDDAAGLLKSFFEDRCYIYWVPWLKFVKRSLLIENNILFFAIRSGDDFVWTIELLCAAKRFVIVPEPTYYWRYNSTSITRSQREPSEQVKFWVSVITDTTKYLERLWDKYDVLKENSLWLYKAINYAFDESFIFYALNARVKVTSDKIFEALNSSTSLNTHIAYLYGKLDFMHKQLFITKNNLKSYSAQAQKRIAELEAQLKTK